MDENTFLKLIEEVLEVDEGTIKLSMTLEEIDWDSLSNLTLISLLDSQFELKVGSQQLQDADTFNDLFLVVTSSK